MTQAAQERTSLQGDELPDLPKWATDRQRPPAVGWMIADALLGTGILTAVVAVGNLDRMPLGIEEFLAVRVSVKNVVLLSAFGFAWPTILSLCGLYAPARLRTGRGEWSRLLVAVAAGTILAMVFPLASRSGAVRPEHPVLFGLIALPVSAALRAGTRAIRKIGRKARQRKVIIVGSGRLARRLRDELESDPDYNNEILGFVDAEGKSTLAETGLAQLGVVTALERILMHREVDAVFIGLPIKSKYEEIQHTLAACKRVGVPASYPTALLRGAFGVALVDGGTPSHQLSLPVAPDDYRLVMKRIIDVMGAAILLALLSPFMLAIAVTIKLTSQGPILFEQERYGFMKRRFRMLKFRTMVADADKLQSSLEVHNEATGPVFKIRNDPRITPIGRFLRRSSLDELPQLWHVLAGEMSLVGPRPMATRDVGLFPEPWLMRRFSVRPGLTCLWQTSGRSDLRFEDWIALDLEYIDRWSLSLDFWILLRTIPAVLSGRGAS